MNIVRKSVLLLLLSATAFAQVFVKPADITESKAFHKTFNTLASTSRPSRDNHYLTPGGHFIIHYDNSGNNAVPQDYTYHDSIPDFVYKAAEYLDESYSALHDSLGYNAPPTDNIESPEIDVYFRYDKTYYGVTYPDDNLGDDSWTSYLTLSTQLEDSTVFYTYGLEGLRVTCAHELFHIFQLGYKYRTRDIFYFEMSSVWFEEYMYPEVNDYHSYVNEYTGDWNYKLDHDNLDYDNVGFNLYIDKRFSTSGNNIINNIWNRIITVSAITAIRNELEARSITFEEALRDWGTAQVLCGPYSSNNFQYAFNDAADLETISFARNTDHILTALSGDISLTIEPATVYFKLSGMPNSVMLFEGIFDEGALANLVCLNGHQSEVKRISSTPIVIDGTQFSDYILVLGADADNVNGAYSFTALEENQLANLYPNPLSIQQSLTLSYVLLENNLHGSLSIYDLKGRKVYSNLLADQLLSVGLHDISFIPPELSSGIYIVALHFDDTVIAEKFTFLK